MDSGVWVKPGETNQLDQMASRAKGLSLRSLWIMEDMSICRHVGILIPRYIDISVDSGGLSLRSLDMSVH